MSKFLVSVAAAFALVASMVPVGAIPSRAEAAENGNFEFTVQYYAGLDTLVTGTEAKDGYASLSIIDTSGGKLPTNTTTPNTMSIYVNKTTGELLYKTKNTEIYKASKFNYYDAPVLACFDKVTEADNGFTLSEVWVKYSSDEKWTKYNYAGDGIDEHVHFTNDPAKANKTDTVLLKEGAIVRLVYDKNTTNVNIPTTFYDYDITDGSYYLTKDAAEDENKLLTYPAEPSDSWYASNSSFKTYTNTVSKGINSPGNYKGSGAKLAFGNENTGTMLGGTQVWNKNLINGYNAKNGSGMNNSYEGCAFGLVTGLSGNTLQYASGVVAPKLFNDGEATGKKTVTGKSLVFDRTGDTFTLTAVANGESADSKQILKNLDKFNNPATNGTVYKHIWTNNFWPMDDRTIGSSNTGKDLEFGDYRYEWQRLFIKAEQTGSTDNSLPVSDDGVDHNSFFGMNYDVEFTIDDDYTGPLEYLFFGDDDMWVFLDGKLVCDIGGVHSSVGEYVNLWDYIDGGKDNHKTATHTLSFFYTERGASGSTCFMQFTLPGVTEAQPYESGTLEIKKDAYALSADGQKIDLEDAATAEYEFEVELGQNASCSEELVCAYPFTVYDAAGKAVQQGVTSQLTEKANGTKAFIVKIKDGQSFKISYLPIGSYYKVTEINGKENLDTLVDGVDTAVAKGQISAVGQTVTRQFDNVQKTGSLAVSKTVAGNAGDTAKAWDFTVSMTAPQGVTLASSYPYVIANADGSTTEGSLALSNGEGSFSLTHGQTITISNMPVNTECVVAETAANADGYATSVNGSGRAVINADVASECNFTNEKNLVSVAKAWNDADDSFAGESIKVQLLQDGQAYGDPVNLNEANGWAYTWSTEQDGLLGDHEWTVQELDVPYGYAPTVEKLSENGADQGLSYKLTNSLSRGTLAISKTVTGNTGDKNAEWQFNVALKASNRGTINLAGAYTYTVTGSDEPQKLQLDANGKGSLVLKHGQTATIAGLPIGTEYEVTEVAANQGGYITVVAGGEGVIPDSGKAKTVSFTNDKNTVSITKDWNDGDNVYLGEIEVQLKQTDAAGVTTIVDTAKLTADNPTKTWDGLASGYVWSVNEVNVPEGYQLTNIIPDGNQISFEEEGPAEFTVTNTLLTDYLSISKEVVGNNGDEDAVWEFDVALTAPQKLRLATAFPYAISQGGQTIEEGTLTFQNNVASVELKHGQTATIEGLPHGTQFAVTEQGAGTADVANDGGYFTRAEGATGEIDATTANQAQANFVNERNTVTVTKAWDNAYGSFAGESVQVQLLADGKPCAEPVELNEGNKWTYTWTNLKSGPQWTVEEVDVPYGFVQTVTQTSDDSVTEGLAYQISNEIVTGQLAISKTVTGNTGDRNAEWEFFVELQAAEEGTIKLADSYGYTIIEDETTVGTGTLVLEAAEDGNGAYGGTIALKHGQTAVIEGLPVGTLYSVTELNAGTADSANQDGYFTIVAGGAGEIVQGTHEVVSFTNDKNTVSVEKAWEDGDNTYGKSITMQLCKTKNNVTEVHDTVELSDENQWSYTWDGLSSEYFWSVDEVDEPEGYKKSVAITKGDDGRAVFAFTNTLLTDELTVKKVVTGNAADDQAVWTFDVNFKNVKDIVLAPEFACEVYLADGYMSHETMLELDADGNASFQLAAGQWAIIKGLPHGTEYTVTERNAGTSDKANEEGYYTIIALNGQDVAEAKGAIDATDEGSDRVDFTNDKNLITVQKVWDGEGYEYTGEVQVQLLADGEPCADQPWSDPVTLNADNNWTYTWPSLKSGPQWTVAEAELEGFAVTYGEPTQLEGNGGQLSTVTNTLVPGSLVVSKTVSGEGADEQKDWTFEITLKGTDDIRLADSYACEIAPLVAPEEPEDPEDPADGEQPQDPADPQDPAKGDQPSAPQEEGEGNNDQSGDVEDGDDSTKESASEFAFEPSGDNELKLTVTLKHNQKLTISGLPHGATYKVDELEANDSHYKTDINGKRTWSGVVEGSVQADAISRADYTNHYDPPAPPKPSTPGKTGDSLMQTALGLGAVALAGLALALIARKRLTAARRR